MLGRARNTEQNECNFDGLPFFWLLLLDYFLHIRLEIKYLSSTLLLMQPRFHFAALHFCKSFHSSKWIRVIKYSYGNESLELANGEYDFERISIQWIFPPSFEGLAWKLSVLIVVSKIQSSQTRQNFADTIIRFGSPEMLLFSYKKLCAF